LGNAIVTTEPGKSKKVEEVHPVTGHDPEDGQIV
jgi:hypothetical protein